MSSVAEVKATNTTKEMNEGILLERHTFHNHFNLGHSCCEEACSLALARVTLSGSMVEIGSTMVIPRVATRVGSDEAH